MNELTTSVVTVLMAIIGVAIIAVLVSRNAQTGSVLQAGGNAFSNVLGSALSPITGGGFTGGGVPSLGLNITG
jgi:Na+/phosphate symporter